jgi:hypothetical protein
VVQFLGLDLGLAPRIGRRHRGGGRKGCCKKLTKKKAVIRARHCKGETLPFGGNFVFAPLDRRRHLWPNLGLLSSEAERATGT